MTLLVRRMTPARIAPCRSALGHTDSCKNAAAVVYNSISSI